MTLDEKDSCLIMAKGIAVQKLEKLAAEVYEGDELQSVTIEEYTLIELIDLLKRTIKQLIAELNSDSWKLLPNSLIDARQNSVSLKGQLTGIYNSLTAKESFDSWLPYLLFIIRYEMNHGFWDRSKSKVHNLNELNLAKAQTDVNVLIQDLRNGLDETNKVYNRLESSIKDLNNYTEQKEHQFNSLEKTLELASQSLASVRNSEKEASTSNGKIATLLDQTDKTLDASRKKINQDRKTFDELRGDIATVRQQVSDEFDQLSEHRIAFDGLVASAREAETHILDQEERIMTLVGFAADGTLGGVFNNRKKELQWSVGLWIGLSLASVALAVYWVLYVFQKTPSQDHNGVNWLILLANVVRTSPMFVLVYFCLSQYTKERNIQEEYAFKSAVSMTVTAYADMIGTGEVNERVKMLMDTIQRIYVPPVLGKPIKPVSIRSKHFAQAAKSMADTAQNMKSAMADTLESIKPTKSS